MSVPAEFTREKVIEFLARIITGASRAQLAASNALRFCCRSRWTGKLT